MQAACPNRSGGYDRKRLLLLRLLALAGLIPVVCAAPPESSHWAFGPLRVQQPGSEGIHGSPHPVDRYVLAKLQEKHLRPVSPAPKHALLRRVYLDLIGLPPPPEVISQFVSDDSEDAWPKLIEKLLASPHYGERWGRHWMDVVRYADTAGDNADYPVPEAYRYRDYLIASFNADKPYDQFVREQLAGDILAKRGPADRYAEQLVATGFLALSRRYATGPYELWHLTLENTIETVGQAFLGVNLRCARCHDHKYDPLTTEDYYGLYGIFSSTEFPWPGGEELQSRSIARQKFVPLIPSSEAEPMMRSWREQIEQLRAGMAAAETQKEQLAALKKQLRDLERPGLPPGVPAAYAVQEGKAADAPIHLKGEPERQGPAVPRRAPRCFAGEVPLEIPDGSSGRLEFANWLTRPDNALFARVMANRIWQHHFGKGLVATPNNFGSRGDPPSHPELLDFLAARLIESGWSVKAMHRLILRSAAYRLSSESDPHNLERDPSNRYYWRFDRRRLDAEALRDSMLSASGLLDLQPPGAHPFPPPEKWNWTQHSPFKEIYPTRHRSVYLMTPRFQRHPFLALFDGPDPNTSTEARRASIVPQQALYALNNPFVDEQARAFARRVLSLPGDLRGRLRYSHELIWGRAPAESDLARAEAFLTGAREMISPPENPDHEAWASLGRVLLSSNEFMYAD